MIFDELELQIQKLYKYCLTLTRSSWAAEDLVQETILKVYRLKQTDPNRTFSYSFLCIVAKNLFIDEKRKQKEQINFLEDVYGEEDSRLELDSLLEVLFSSLPLKQAMLVTLKDVFGYTTKEIAAMLRVSNEVVKTTLHRSRKKLQTKASSTDLPPYEIIPALSAAIKQSNPMKIFYYYRLLEAQNYQLRRESGQSVFHVIDPDGNILEIQSRN
ncbi:RNA polymerase sigma factor [Ornithinibacillus californiensis]|uniref:RNA polymerase sigma factor n=1 Tax=Ornithinibacillus californiensis TaxID=161536 RepID=UPI00064E08CB|nr:RNA polymerase sigma factor [Ornithinibacillus californiensis]